MDVVGVVFKHLQERLFRRFGVAHLAVDRAHREQDRRRAAHGLFVHAVAKRGVERAECKRGLAGQRPREAERGEGVRRRHVALRPGEFPDLERLRHLAAEGVELGAHGVALLGPPFALKHRVQVERGREVAIVEGVHLAPEGERVLRAIRGEHAVREVVADEGGALPHDSGDRQHERRRVFRHGIELRRELCRDLAPPGDVAVHRVSGIRLERIRHRRGFRDADERESVRIRPVRTDVPEVREKRERHPVCRLGVVPDVLLDERENAEVEGVLENRIGYPFAEFPPPGRVRRSREIDHGERDAALPRADADDVFEDGVGDQQVAPVEAVEKTVDVREEKRRAARIRGRFPDPRFL